MVMRVTKRGNLPKLLRALESMPEMVKDAVVAMGEWTENRAEARSPVVSGNLHDSWDLLVVGTEFTLSNMAEHNGFHYAAVVNAKKGLFPTEAQMKRKFSEIAKAKMEAKIG